MQHYFFSACLDPEELLDGVSTIKQFMKNLEKQAKIAERENKHSYNDYTGHGFEALMECYISNSPIDKTVDVKEGTYKIITVKEDFGVDGVGESFDGSNHTFQFKYRSDTSEVLTANEDHISNFYAYSHSRFNTVNMTLVTTCRGVRDILLTEMYGNNMKVWNFDKLKKIFDGNTEFWNLFLQSFSNKNFKVKYELSEILEGLEYTG